MPRDILAERTEPSMGGLRVNEGRRVDDRPSLVVDDRTAARAEEAELRQG
jgi:hypothetical protein